jgi:SHS2 domain-containing protein
MFTIEQHTADIRIRVVAAAIEELFIDSIRGLMAVMQPSGGASPVEETVDVSGPDTTALLIDLLNEVLSRAHIHRAAYEPESIVLRDGSATARLRRQSGATFEEDVKAVTWHEADVRQDGADWITTLVLDV